ncbi:hypothetical protein H6P81_016749 [Aristolochia fimbriata]|uniref:Uncharacterized protein n=1 Tax=Aristolochia fimbriata TaxID=158543 RepID=A0AAV7E9V1_ARIFI|nr:hypothetical protein H6P81_016749 [Aristolochia fimbriata]
MAASTRFVRARQDSKGKLCFCLDSGDVDEGYTRAHEGQRIEYARKKSRQQMGMALGFATRDITAKGSESTEDFNAHHCLNNSNNHAQEAA